MVGRAFLVELDITMCCSARWILSVTSYDIDMPSFEYTMYSASNYVYLRNRLVYARSY